MNLLSGKFQKYSLAKTNPEADAQEVADKEEIMVVGDMEEVEEEFRTPKTHLDRLITGGEVEVKAEGEVVMIRMTNRYLEVTPGKTGRTFHNRIKIEFTALESA